MSETATARSREKLFDGGEENESFSAGAIGHLSQRVERRGRQVTAYGKEVNECFDEMNVFV